MAAESFVFQTAGQILGKLATDAFREIGLVWGVKKNLERLQSTVTAIKAVLLDAAEQKKKKNRQVEDWLEKLQDVLYDIDDVLDDFMTEDLRRKVVIKGSKRKAVKNFFSSSNSLALRISMSHKLKNIRSRLEDIDADRKQFALVERALDSPVAYPLREQTHSFIRASNVIGRDHDKNRIIKVLLSNCSSSTSSGMIENIPVLPIVGLGGLGKTTLAKLVYNDDAITSNFETRLWICVLEEFDLKKMIEKMMKDATGRADHANLDLNQLQNSLRTTLDSKKFLLVLDDVWNEDRQKWTELKDLLNCGSHGSKIVITTRKKTTAKIMGTLESYKLKGLSNDECMSIFVKHAFKEGEEKQYPKLMEIGKAIVMKCSGLPLAVKSLGSILYTKREEREWQYINDNDVWKIEQKENDVLPILKLSYDEMPLHLKQCFAHCATFPKNFSISNYDVIQQWMAHGFIQSFDDSWQLEDIGNQYFHELLSRSFFQYESISFDSTLITVKMHDLVHDLALSVAGKDVSRVNYDTRNIFEGTRHLLFSAVRLEGKEFPNFLLKLNKVRSFSFEFEVGPISKTFVDTLIKTFSCLCILDLFGSTFEELPSFVGSLKHLRYLDLESNRNIKALPNTICNLVNLQSLNLSNCVMLQDLPRDFGNLSRLRNLYLTSKMTCFPKKEHAEGLRSLQYLSIQSSDHLESLLGGMKNFTALRYLSIYKCPSLTSLPAESIKYLTSLEILSICQCDKLDLLAEDTTMELPRGLFSLELEDIPKLKELPRGFGNAAATIKYITIRVCPSFEILPEWLQNCASLTKLQLVNCVLLKSVPLGMHQLTALRELHIKNCSKNLIEKCKWETGKYWPCISQTPENYLRGLKSKNSH
ncbi:hypothetical protein LguiA_026380 [Lonicera macranthoides]